MDLRGGSPSTVEAVATVKVLDNQVVPTGYMGANARLYNSSGALQVSSGPVYNVGTLYMFFVYSPRISTAGQYYAHNEGFFYNGNGYNHVKGALPRDFSPKPFPYGRPVRKNTLQ